MKKFASFIVAALVFCAFVSAQSPQLIPFQAIVRDTNNVILAGHAMSIKISLLSGSPTGTLIYQEIQSATTNALGLLDLSIGQGTVESGSMSGINWGSGPMYVEIDVDLSGGSSFSELGVTQLQSVPYALYAANSGGSGWGLTGNSGTSPSTNFVGTIDNQDLQFGVNSQVAGIIENNNNNQSTALGYQALAGETTNSYTNNVAMGYQALNSNTNGTSNVGIGYQALAFNTYGSNNVAVGLGALNTNTSGSLNTAVGYGALYSNYTGFANTSVGDDALTSNWNGSYNSAFGSAALAANSSGNYNTGIGVGGLNNNDAGNTNSSLGWQALFNNSEGSSNVAVGSQAGWGASGIDFNQCTFIGASSYPTSSAYTNVTMLGYGIADGQVTANNEVLLGNTSVTEIRAQVSGITTYSDARYKTNVQDNVVGLDFIMKLKPVTYNVQPKQLHNIWGTPSVLTDKIDHSEIERMRFIGFLAQDVEKAAAETGFTFPGIDVPKNDKQAYALRYTDFIMPLVKAVQEQQQLIEQLKNDNASLKAQNDQLNQNVNNTDSKYSQLKAQVNVLQQLMEKNGIRSER